MAERGTDSCTDGWTGKNGRSWRKGDRERSTKQEILKKEVQSMLRTEDTHGPSQGRGTPPGPEIEKTGLRKRMGI